MDLDAVVRICAALCWKFEGCYLRPYLCPAGIPTIGVGATFYEDGRKVTLHDAPLTRERAQALLLFHIRRRFLPEVARLCPGLDTPPRLAAICDFAFNLGTGKLRASTLRRRANEQDWEEVRAQLKRWNRAGGRELKGLTIRRAAESAMV